MVNRKSGTMLLISGLDTSLPAEYISEQASPRNENMEVRSGLLCKRVGTSVYGSTMGGASASPSSSPSSSVSSSPSASPSPSSSESASPSSSPSAS